MHNIELLLECIKIYLTSREYQDCFKGKFWCSLLLLFYLAAVYLPQSPKILLVASQFQVNEVNCLWLTQICLDTFYIPELIQPANNTETNPGPPCFYNIYM